MVVIGNSFFFFRFSTLKHIKNIICTKLQIIWKYLSQQFFFHFQQIRNKNCPWQPCFFCQIHTKSGISVEELILFSEGMIKIWKVYGKRDEQMPSDGKSSQIYVFMMWVSVMVWKIIEQVINVHFFVKLLPKNLCVSDICWYVIAIDICFF
jgi:hypothetical protein